MEQYVIALILGVIEGITECIPVSITVKAFLWYLNRSSRWRRLDIIEL